MSNGDPHALSPSLLREGRSMVAALASDFARIDHTEVVLVRDARHRDLALPACRQVMIHNATEEREAIERLAGQADRTVVIAPECQGALAERSRWVEAAGGRLLSPSPDFILCAGNKTATAELLRSRAVPTPRATTLRPGDVLPADFDYPGVLKPNDGAGSVGVQMIVSCDDDCDLTASGPGARLERYCPGLAASVAVLCGPAGNLPLPACRQSVSDDGRFRYLGGETPLDPARSRRARSLTLAAIDCLPPTIGYVGVDLVLGESADGSDDVVIEVNPRLTTSYIGLRRLVETNLAAAMLAVAEGQVIDLSQARPYVTFDLEGVVAGELP